ncbi:hypothetical protein IMY05_003G0031200 [Salix suchowensis]|nr:hypothetical protein IMY05_003G0031200 [Salix suchowensis]
MLRQHGVAKGYKETTAEADDTNAENAKIIVSMSDQIGEKLPSVSMNSFETTAHERETERFQKFLQYLSGNIDDHVESDISGGGIFGSQHHELFSYQKEFQCEISVSFPLLYAYQNIELQTAVGQCDKLGAIIHSFPEYVAYKDSKESVGLLSKGYVKDIFQETAHELSSCAQGIWEDGWCQTWPLFSFGKKFRRLHVITVVRPQTFLNSR